MKGKWKEDEVIFHYSVEAINDSFQFLIRIAIEVAEILNYSFYTKFRKVNSFYDESRIGGKLDKDDLRLLQLLQKRRICMGPQSDKL